MVWAYYDESGEYTKHEDRGTLLNMSVGGCVAPLEKWESFNAAWKAALDAEGLEYFHMVDFERWCGPFDFKLPDGRRDQERHNRILNALLDIMLGHVEWFGGFAATTVLLGRPGAPDEATTGRRSKSKRVVHGRWLTECIGSAVRHAALEVAEFYDDKVHLVFGQQEHVSKVNIQKIVDFFNKRTGGKIGGVTVNDPKCLRPLQAADIWAYEFSKAQRILLHPPRYPFKRLIEGALAKGSKISTEWGPPWGRKFKRLSDLESS
jgi:hypothetical protein